MQSLLFSQLTFRSAWRRVLAQLIDLAFVWLMTVGAFVVTTVIVRNRWLTTENYFWAYLTTLLVYSVWFDIKRQGTPGKLMLGLRVVCTSKIRPLFFTSFYRNLLKVVLMILIVDCIFMIMGKQGFHNRMVDCQVIRKSP